MGSSSRVSGECKSQHVCTAELGEPLPVQPLPAGATDVSLQAQTAADVGLQPHICSVFVQKWEYCLL